MSEAWRANIKKFLFMERKPDAIQNNKTITESHRYSLDIDEDLKNIIEKKKNQNKILKNHLCIETENQKQLTTTATEPLPDYKYRMDRLEIGSDENMFKKTDMDHKPSNESFEALEKMCEKTSDPNSTLYKYLNGDDEQKTNNVLVWQQTSDESFEALEKMCDKTASDPNSTLFQYLHSDRKDQVLDSFKKRSIDDNTDDYIREKEENLLIKFNNCTILDEIEAPSRIWENTLCDDTEIQTSPIKMVGLLRPSTIIEEAPDETCNSDVSSQQSFKTTTKTDQIDVSSSTYDTAHDSTSASNRFDNSSQDPKQKLEIIDVDNILLSAIERSQKQQESNENIMYPTLNIMDTTIVELPSSNSDENNDSITKSSEVSLNLIDLERTFEPHHDSPHSPILEYSTNNNEDTEQKSHVENKSGENTSYSQNLFDDSIIEILSDEDDNDAENREDNAISGEEVMMCSVIKSERNSISTYSLNQETFSLNESLEDKENDSALRESSDDKSMHFNDTMEEVEYMLKKGMEYMAAQAALKQNSESVNMNVHLSADNATKPNSPLTHKKSVKNVSSSASKIKSYTYCTTTPAKKTTPAKNQNVPPKRFGNDMVKPFPKLDLFSKPPMHARHKELTSQQQKFSHIVSPIGTYMKKTAKTPLMSSLNSKNTDYFNSTAIQELENESRLYQPQFALSGGESTGLPGITSSMKRPLAKKAYISSDLKHIVDERTPVTIPGGKKIQKYLENAIMPAVLRHDGKFKIPGGTTGTGNKLNTLTATSPSTSIKQPLKASDTNSTVATKSSHATRSNNASLADLSLMSGDVSMYTIMDAQKF